jgi:hypothetical protein
MKTALSISIFLNCALLGILAFLLLSGRLGRNPVDAPVNADTLRPGSEAVMSAPVATPATVVTPFQWSQIESADYPSYIANLRAIGCPEQTIRDIITADVDSNLYAARRQPLEEKRAAPTLAGRLEAEARLRELNKQEASAIAAMLAPASAATRTTPTTPFLGVGSSALADVALAPANSVLASPGAQSIIPVRSHPEPSTSGTAAAFSASPSPGQKPPVMISVPLVFHEVDPSILTLNPQQAQVVDDLRQKFIEAVGGPNQDPNDPAYLQRWQASQPEVDVDLWTLLGINAFQAHQIAAWDEAHVQTRSGH